MPAQGEECGRIADLIHLVEDNEHLAGLGAEIGQDAHGRVVKFHDLRLGDIEDPALIEGRVARVQLDEATGRYAYLPEFFRPRAMGGARWHGTMW